MSMSPEVLNDDYLSEGEPPYGLRTVHKTMSGTSCKFDIPEFSDDLVSHTLTGNLYLVDDEIPIENFGRGRRIDEDSNYESLAAFCRDINDNDGIEESGLGNPIDPAALEEVLEEYSELIYLDDAYDGSRNDILGRFLQWFSSLL